MSSSDAPEVEEAVTVDRVRRPPDRTGEDRAPRGDPREGPALGRLGDHRRTQERRNERSSSERGEEPERRQDGAVEHEGERESACKRGEAPHERGGERNPEGRRAAEGAHEDPSGHEEHAGGSGGQPETEPEPVRGQQAAEDEGGRRGGDEPEEEHARADPARPGAVDLHGDAHGSQPRASSASAPACMQMPPRARTSSMNCR